MVSLSRESRGTGIISSAAIRSAASGLIIHSHIIKLDWQFKPTIGLVAKDIDRLGVDIRSFREPLTRSIKRVLIPSFRTNFQVGGRPAWAPLADITVKARNYSAWPILVRRGTLKRVATQFNIWNVGQISAVIRQLPQKAWYGVVHQGGLELQRDFTQYSAQAQRILGSNARSAAVMKLALKLQKAAGAKETEGEIPARPFIMIQPQDQDKIVDVFSEWLQERVERVGRFSA